MRSPPGPVVEGRIAPRLGSARGQRRHCDQENQLIIPMLADGVGWRGHMTIAGD